MTFFAYLRDHAFHFFFWLGSLVLLNLILWLEPSYTIHLATLLYLDGLLSIFFFIFMGLLYWHELPWYRAISERQQAQDDALNWPLNEANSNAQQQIQDYVDQLLRAHQQSLENEISAQQDQREFIDSWVHEIKVPLAATRLLIESVEEDLPDKKFTQFELELQKINFYVEQVLYYSRLNDFAKDYLIQEYPAKPIINDLIRDNMNYFFEKQIHVEVNGPDVELLTDEKWLRFILEQILSNSLRYTPKGGTITITTKHAQRGNWITIADTGIGIPPQDLPRVFDKGFTGSNGRQSNERATGLGLYLAQQMSRKLGHQLTIASTQGQGTTVTLFFPLLSYYNDENGDFVGKVES
ncbi:his Kinase A domain protein [Lactobacillus selangorensis]|uniref:histidine kinase n=1 Tax=Lactobacillus selangorensis TaxID=81857 RepID=A0A0R2G2Z8_9LACO|nr:sensor histidine kinase [Lactobacillus selangorensis]KRN28426.1 his Kinase A domain protein [Lactobacillus selangorensis]KRN31927.1 his Kinase A domain protein [Lactobacillus selangorensis]